MKYYTSYIGRAKKLPADVLQVSIMRYTPEYYKPDMELKGLAPKADDLMLFREGKISQMEFTKRYTEKVLSKVNADSMDKYFHSLKQVPEGVAFVCIEKSDEFCHRHILAYHLRKQGLEIEEFEALR